jgi:hypothetical protein
MCNTGGRRKIYKGQMLQVDYAAAYHLWGEIPLLWVAEEVAQHSVAGVLEEPYSQLIPLSGVAVYTGPPVYIGWNRVHPMLPGGPVRLLS